MLQHYCEEICFSEVHCRILQVVVLFMSPKSCKVSFKKFTKCISILNFIFFVYRNLSLERCNLMVARLKWFLLLLSFKRDLERQWFLSFTWTQRPN